jgi:type II secretory pathway component PulF
VRRSLLLWDAGSDGSAVADRIVSLAETRLEALTRNIAAWVEPGMIAVAGSVLLAVILSLVVPLFELYAEILPW